MEPLSGSDEEKEEWETEEYVLVEEDVGSVPVLPTGRIGVRESFFVLSSRVSPSMTRLPSFSIWYKDEKGAWKEKKGEYGVKPEEKFQVSFVSNECGQAFVFSNDGNFKIKYPATLEEKEFFLPSDPLGDEEKEKWLVISPDFKRKMKIGEHSIEVFVGSGKEVKTGLDEVFGRVSRVHFLNSRLLAYTCISRNEWTRIDSLTSIYDLTTAEGIKEEIYILNTDSLKSLGGDHFVFCDFNSDAIFLGKFVEVGGKFTLKLTVIPESEGLNETSLYRIGSDRWLLVGMNGKGLVVHWVLTYFPGEDSYILFMRGTYPEGTSTEEALKEEGSIYPFLYDSETVISLGNFWSQMPEIRTETTMFLRDTTPLADTLLDVITKFIL